MSDRGDCDSSIFAEMMLVCEDAGADGPEVQEDCFFWAQFYWEGLRVGGYPAWLARQKEYCQCCP